MLSALTYAITLPSFAADLGKTNFDSWQVSCIVDDFDNKITCFADSAFVEPKKNFSYSYGNLESRMMVQCDSAGSLGGIYHFNREPLLTNGELIDDEGFFKASLRVKFDDSLSAINIIKRSGHYILAVDFDELDMWLKDVSTNSTHKLEVPWDDLGDVRTEYDLSGAKEAIAEIKKRCAN